MSEGGNGGALDLNNLPEDFTKQASDDTCSSVGTVQRKKKGGGGGSSSSSKVYECRFCSLKFSKSQALGGHMNRHRQERETESLNKARQLVFGNENLAAAAAAPPYSPFPLPPHHLQQGGGYQHHQHQSGPPLMYPAARMYSGHQQQHQPPLPYPSQYHHPPPPPHLHHHQHHPDYFVGENYTCIGAPVAGGHGFMLNSSGTHGGF